MNEKTSLKENENLYSTLSRASSFYAKQLLKLVEGNDFVKRRGLTTEIIDLFEIGYTKNLSYLFNDYSESTNLIDSGLVIEKEYHHRIDRFINRITFPIKDEIGRIVGFGARAIDDRKPKYLNSPETDLYKKSNSLYGLYEGKQAIKDLGFAIVVEGYMDVISLRQMGVVNSVATSGTACTSAQIELLLNYTKKIVFCFDGDSAGVNAALKAFATISPMMKDDINVCFAFLSDGHDPDSFIRAFGVNEYNSVIDKAISYSNYAFYEIAKALNTDTNLEKSASLFNAARNIYKSIGSSKYQNDFSIKIANAFNLALPEVVKFWEAYKIVEVVKFDAEVKRNKVDAKKVISVEKEVYLSSKINQRLSCLFQFLIEQIWLIDALNDDIRNVLSKCPSPYNGIFNWLDSLSYQIGVLTISDIESNMESCRYANYLSKICKKVDSNKAKSINDDEKPYYENLSDLLIGYQINEIQLKIEQIILSGEADIKDDLSMLYCEIIHLNEKN